MSSESAIATRRNPRDKYIRRGASGSQQQHTAGELILQVSLSDSSTGPSLRHRRMLRISGARMGVKWTSGRSFCMFGVSDAGV
jgi:hypothetical protein